jgi:NAD(P)-dependent dehydrogenase (short-subunit alcohol dehydrogenase family)
VDPGDHAHEVVIIPGMILVTGATDGLGLALARRLAAGGADVLVHGRDRDRVAAAAEAVGAAGSFVADFSRLADVRALADELPALDVLVNNAGVIAPERVVTEDGNELTFQVNYLAHFLLTLRQLDGQAPRRVVNVASAGQMRPDFEDLMLKHGYDEWRAYRQSKLAQIMFTFECARRYPATEHTALHPATFMDTKMVRETIGDPHSAVDEGAEATVRLADDLDLDVQGRYFNGLRQARADPAAYDAQARQRLWDVSEQLIARS